MELRDEALPEVGDGEVRIQTLLSGLSSGTEMLVYRGQVPDGMTLDLPTLAGSYDFPIKYGYACIGRVVEAGVGSELEVGDLVFVHHPHQTQFVVPSAMPLRLAPDLIPEAGLFFANAETAVNILLDAHPHLGERVVIFGQGVVGLLVAQLTKMAGAGIVVTVDPIESRRAISRGVGADSALDPREDLAQAIAGLTDGRGADIVIEVSGNPAALNQAIECVAKEGTVVVASWYGTKQTDVNLGGSFHRGRVKLVSSQVGSIAPTLNDRWDRGRRSSVALGLLQRLQLEPLITHRIPFERAAEAYELVDRRPNETIQVVLTYE